jgi:diguanylate cyclase (GGDEF)-like protein
MTVLNERIGSELVSRLEELEHARSSDVQARLAEARELERLASATGGVPLMRARLVIADMVHRVGDLAQGAALATAVRSWAEAEGDRPLLARAHLVLSSVFDGIGDFSASLDHAVQAIDLLDDGTPDRDRGVHLLRLADALALNNSEDAARARYQEAEAIFATVGDRTLELTALNNLAVLEYEAGNVDAAVRASERLHLAASSDELNADFADTIARARLLGGDLSGADDVVRRGYQLLRGQGDSQAATPAELLLTHVDVLLAMGQTLAAHQRLEECLQVCAERGLDGIRVRAMAVRAELLAAQGDFEAAYHTYREFHAASERRRSQRLEAAARARHALFETAEARREARRFWEQARTDPLTGLFNRRYLDEHLPLFLKDGPGEGRCLVAAVLDVDHFKRINDRYSHDVGDAVLRELGSLIAATVDVERSAHGELTGFAARLGGEEFLLVRVLDSAQDAVAQFERLRESVQGHDWQAIAEGLAVTVSVGVAVLDPDDTQRSLLTRADHHLYQAKRAGRNRVRADLPDPPR